MDQKLDNVHSIIVSNILRMQGQTEGELQYLLNEESSGPKAKNRKWSMVANFYFSPDEGEITYFGNSQHVSKEIKQSCDHAQFVMAYDELKTGTQHVAELFIKKSKKSFAYQTLIKTAHQYNNLADREKDSLVRIVHIDSR
tara:strand:- start:51495 stop:51917 length:423 start_codon:yes stop_codon:yes gene_type:complete